MLFCSCLLYIQLDEPPKKSMFESSINQRKQKSFFLVISFNELAKVCFFLSILQTNKVDHNFALYMYLSLHNKAKSRLITFWNKLLLW